VPDRNGKIFYTSITSLSHISKCGREEAYDKSILLSKMYYMQESTEVA
jgi:hypothetical protein